MCYKNNQILNFSFYSKQVYIHEKCRRKWNLPEVSRDGLRAAAGRGLEEDLLSTQPGGKKITPLHN